MAKPVINSFEALAPIIIQRYESYLPTAFDESMTLVEKMNKIIQYLNSMGLLVNSVVEQWNEVMEWVMNDGLNEAVADKLNEWLNDGTINNIINEQIFGELNQKVDNLLINLNQRAVRMTDYYDANIDTVNEAMIEFLKTQYKTVYIPYGTHNVLDTSRFIGKNVSVIGDGQTKLKTMQDGLRTMMLIEDASNFIVSGIQFDNNLKGRNALELNNCYDFIIEKCSFTGYTADFSVHPTDSAILIKNSKRGRISKNTFKDWGYQYGTATSTLNRCITLNDLNTDDMIISENIMERVNQGIIVAGGKNNMINNNKMEDVKDNCVYVLAGVKGIQINNNTFRNRNDECIVFAGENIQINNNKIYDTPNKALAVNGDCKNVQIVGNTIDNSDVTTGQLFMYRESNYTVENLIITDNIFRTPDISGYTRQFEFFNFGNVKNLKFENNLIDVKTQEYERIMFFTGGTPATGSIKNNFIQGSFDNTVAIDVTVDSPNLVFDSNELIKCRGKYGNYTVRNQLLQTNVGPYVLGLPKTNVYYSSALPTAGKFMMGDVIHYTGTDYNILLWRRAVTGTGHVLGTDWIEIRRYVPV